MKLVNIILFVFISLSATCQQADTLIYYSQSEVDSILSLKTAQIADLVTANTKLQTRIDSLQALGSSSSFIRVLDTAYVYIAGDNGYSVEVRKTGNQINTEIVKDSLRIASFFGDSRSVYIMDGNRTKSSIIEDSTGYYVNFITEEITINKRK